MSIFPLQQFEADLAEAEREAYERLKPPTSIVVRFGALRFVGEYPYSGDAKPGCGSRLVVRTHRGTELGEMLTSTCPNAGCSKSVSRAEMLQYIENSGGPDYPFFTDGRVLRVATIEDLNRQSALEARKSDLLRSARAATRRLDLPMKVVDAEPILGGEKITFYFNSEERIDFRDLVQDLAAEHHTRIEMRQVGARDEARLVADYERCGQHCCCKQFLKVLKPISMRSAKVQKATLDPLKISGRCGRLMCCLRYEDETYETLRKRLPHMKSRVGTPEGPGIVIDSQILTQLVLVHLENEDRRVAVPVEDLSEPPPPGEPTPPPAPRPPRREAKPERSREGPRSQPPKSSALPPSAPAPPREGDPLRGMDPDAVERRARDPNASPRSKQQRQDEFRKRSQRDERRRQDDRGRSVDPARRAQPRPQQPPPGEGQSDAGAAPPQGEPPGEGARRRRRRRRGNRPDQGDGGAPSGGGG